MHSQTIKATLHNYLRVGIFASSLAGGVVADGMGPAHPMSGACFLHDSGLEYIPNRILGHEDVATPVDRGEYDRWTCTDPLADCERYAERRELQLAAIEAWDRAFSVGKELKAWTGDAIAELTVQCIQRWNGSLVGLGRDLGKRFSIESNPDPDCPWDRLAANATLPGSELALLNDAILREHANIFVFTLGTTQGCHPIIDSPEPFTAAETAPIASPSDRPLPGLSGTTFARDYCIFAPYPLEDSFVPSLQPPARPSVDTLDKVEAESNPISESS
ncbi:MAG: hypothetical protein MUF23_13865, partial [Pirellula sp.]|nr:hypothetical protein [Pirellula sp.]